MDTISNTSTAVKDSNFDDQQRSSIFSRLIFAILSILSFLIPIFFIPGSLIPISFAKHSLFALLVAVALVLWSIETIKTGVLSFTKSPLLAGIGLLAVISLISSLFSQSFNVSFFGLGNEPDTTLAIILLAAFAFLVSVFCNTKKKVAIILLSLLASFLLVTLYQLILSFWPNSSQVDFGMFLSPTITPLGSWYNLAIFIGLGVVFLLAALDMLYLNKALSAISIALIVLALLVLALINFRMVWIMLALSSVAIFAYETAGRLKSQHSNQQAPLLNNRKIPTPNASLFIFIIAIFFVVAGGTFSSLVSDFVGTEYVEGRPSWNSTVNIAEKTLTSSPILGSGPNTFSQVWDQHKPADVNQTIFWNTDYNSGIGYIPTFFITHGVLGFLAWLAIGIFIVVSIAKMLFGGTSEPNRFIFIVVSVSAVYLWLIAFLYVPSFSILAILFLFLGLILSLLSLESMGQLKKVVFTEKVNIAFVNIFALSLIMLGSAWIGYTSARQLAAIAYFRSGLISVAEGAGFESGIIKLEKALSIYQADLYYRSLSELNIRNLNSLLPQLSEEEIQSALQNTLVASVDLSQRALAYDPKNSDNWLSLASVYEYMASFGVEGALNASKEAYQEAEKIDPLNPEVDLGLARLALLEDDQEAVGGHISSALEKKPDYTEALLLLSQLSLGQGDTEEALRTMTLAALSSPQNADIYLNMGIVLYNQSRFEEAIPVLERSVVINPFYANAKYFLALSYYEVGRREDAILQFEDIVSLNPENTQARSILDNLKSGLSPFNSLEPEAEEAEESQ